MMELTAFQRRVAAAVVSVAAVTAMAATAPPRADAQQYWGSIARSQHLDEQGYPQLGGRVNLPTQPAAESAALSDCGLSDCVTFLNFQECAVAGWDAADKQLVGGYGPTLKDAIQAAAKYLPPGGKAQIVMQGCNKGSG